MTEQEHMALHRDHRARIERLEANLVVMAQRTEKIMAAHEKVLKAHDDAIRALTPVVKKTQEQINGLAGYGAAFIPHRESFTPRRNTQPGGTRSHGVPFIPRVGEDDPRVREEDAEIYDEDADVAD